MAKEKSILARRIYQLRKELKLTQEELALKLGLKGKSSIANYESGNIIPSDEVKLNMCKIFNCSMDYLMGKNEYRTHDEMMKVYLKTQYEIDVHNAIINSELFFLNAEFSSGQVAEALNIIQNILFDETSDEIKGTKLGDFVNSFYGKQKEIMKKVVKNILDYISKQEKYRIVYSNLVNIKLNEKPKYFMTPVYRAYFSRTTKLGRRMYRRKNTY